MGHPRRWGYNPHLKGEMRGHPDFVGVAFWGYRGEYGVGFRGGVEWGRT
jgi:hypothetical protein